MLSHEKEVSVFVGTARSHIGFDELYEVGVAVNDGGLRPGWVWVLRRRFG